MDSWKSVLKQYPWDVLLYKNAACEVIDWLGSCFKLWMQPGGWSSVEYLHLQLIMWRRAQLCCSTPSPRTIKEKTLLFFKAWLRWWLEDKYRFRAKYPWPLEPYQKGHIKMPSSSWTRSRASTCVVTFMEPCRHTKLTFRARFPPPSPLEDGRMFGDHLDHINVLPQVRRHKLFRITALSQYIRRYF